MAAADSSHRGRNHQEAGQEREGSFRPDPDLRWLHTAPVHLELPRALTQLGALPLTPIPVPPGPRTARTARLCAAGLYLGAYHVRKVAAIAQLAIAEPIRNPRVPLATLIRSGKLGR